MTAITRAFFIYQIEMSDVSNNAMSCYVSTYFLIISVISSPHNSNDTDVSNS